MRKSGHPRDKACQAILDILKPCDILRGQTAKQRITIIQTTTDQCISLVLVSRSGQLQEQGFSVEVAERVAAPQRSSTRTIYKSKWSKRNGAEKIQWISPLPL